MMQTTLSTSSFSTTLKRIAGFAAFIALAVMVLSLCSDVMQRKASDYKYTPFFEHADDVDVLLMGSSHMMNAVLPMEMWHDHGITAYNFGGHSNTIPTSYWVMENALDYAKPRVVVIDCAQLSLMEKTADNKDLVHQSLDAFPFSLTKFRAVTDLLNDPHDTYMNLSARINMAAGFLWDYSIYHARWKELEEEDFVPSYTYEYGAESRIAVSEPGDIVVNNGDTLTADTTGTLYLKRMIEGCKARGIDVVLVFLPFPVMGEGTWTDINSIAGLAAEYGVDYINYHAAGIVDYDTDCYDIDSHMNPSGAWKITDHLGAYLQGMGVPDHRGEDRYSYWDTDYAHYDDEKIKRLGQMGDLNTYLMLLSDRNLEYEITVGDARIYEDPATVALLRNSGKDIVDEAETAEGGIIEIRVYEPAHGEEPVDISRFAIPAGAPVIDRYVTDTGTTVLRSAAIRVE